MTSQRRREMETSVHWEPGTVTLVVGGQALEMSAGSAMQMSRMLARGSEAATKAEYEREASTPVIDITKLGEPGR